MVKAYRHRARMIDPFVQTVHPVTVKNAKGFRGQHNTQANNTTKPRATWTKYHDQPPAAGFIKFALIGVFGSLLVHTKTTYEAENQKRNPSGGFGASHSLKTLFHAPSSGTRRKMYKNASAVEGRTIFSTGIMVR